MPSGRSSTLTPANFLHLYRQARQKRLSAASLVSCSKPKGIPDGQDLMAH